MVEEGPEPQGTRVLLFKQSSFLFSHQRRMEEWRWRKEVQGKKKRFLATNNHAVSLEKQTCMTRQEDWTERGVRKGVTTERRRVKTKTISVETTGQRRRGWLSQTGGVKACKHNRYGADKGRSAKAGLLSCCTNPAELPAPGPNPKENMQSANRTE